MQPKQLPIDILNRTFARRLRGFDRAAVSGFLEEVASAMEEVLAENASLTQRLRASDDELAKYKATEKTLNEALILAQKTADEIHQNARKEADLILAQAKQDREGTLRSAKEEVSSLQNEIDELNRVKQRFVADLKGLLVSIWQLAQNGRAPHQETSLTPERPAEPDESEAVSPLSRTPW